MAAGAVNGKARGMRVMHGTRLPVVTETETGTGTGTGTGTEMDVVAVRTEAAAAAAAGVCGPAQTHRVRAAAAYLIPSMLAAIVLHR